MRSFFVFKVLNGVTLYAESGVCTRAGYSTYHADMILVKQLHITEVARGSGAEGKVLKNP